MRKVLAVLVMCLVCMVCFAEIYTATLTLVAVVPYVDFEFDSSKSTISIGEEQFELEDVGKIRIPNDVSKEDVKFNIDLRFDNIYRVKDGMYNVSIRALPFSNDRYSSKGNISIVGYDANGTVVGESENGLWHETISLDEAKARCSSCVDPNLYASIEIEYEHDETLPRGEYYASISIEIEEL